MALFDLLFLFVFEVETQSFYGVVSCSILATVYYLSSVNLLVSRHILFLHGAVAVGRSPNHYATYIGVLP